MSRTGPLPIIIAQWQRNARDTVVVRIDQFEGNMVIDIRVWWMSPAGELRPTQRHYDVYPAPARACSCP